MEKTNVTFISLDWPFVEGNVECSIGDLAEHFQASLAIRQRLAYSCGVNVSEIQKALLFHPIFSVSVARLLRPLSICHGPTYIQY